MTATRAALLLLLACAAGAASASALPAPAPAADAANAVQTDADLLDSIYADCLRKDSASCLKYKIYSFVDKALGSRDSLTITDGVQLVKTSENKDGAPRSLNPDDSIESLIFNRIAGFLETHTIKVDLKGSEIVNAVTSTARSFNDYAETLAEDELVEEGRGKKKKGSKMLGPLLAAMAVKAAVLGKLALWGIALIAGKALLVGKIALVLSAIIGLKKLLGSGQGKHVTYEVVAHPQHSSSHVATHESVYAGGSAHGGGYGGDVGGGGYGGGGGSSGHGGWGRSLDAHSLAYRGHVKQE